MIINPVSYSIMHGSWYLQIEVWNELKLWRCFIMQYVKVELFQTLLAGSEQQKCKSLTELAAIS